VVVATIFVHTHTGDHKNVACHLASGGKQQQGSTHTHTYTHTHTAGNGYMLCAPEEHAFSPVTKSYTGLSAYDIVCYLSIFL